MHSVHSVRSEQVGVGVNEPRLGLRANPCPRCSWWSTRSSARWSCAKRTLLPAIAEEEFHLAAKSAVLSFIVVFGVTKALTNYLAGRLSSFRPQTRTVGGWLVAAPVPFLLMVAPSWSWILAANVARRAKARRGRRR
ncbi:MAG: hypothetical protein R3B99_23335 [Polyangiales bacterium]